MKRKRRVPFEHLPGRVRGAIACMVELRYEYDSARDPSLYPPRTVAAVTREGDDVFVVWDVRGEVLTRYSLVRAPGQWHDPPRQAYELLREL